MPRTSLAKPDPPRVMHEIPRETLVQGTHGNRATSPILGKRFQLPSRITGPALLPILDTSLPHVSGLYYMLLFIGSEQR